MSIASLKSELKKLTKEGIVVRTLANNRPESLAEIEGAFSIVLPDSFKALYGEFACIQIGSTEFNSIRELGGAIERTRESGLAKNLVPVMADGLGGTYYVVCAIQKRKPPSDFGSVVFTEVGVAGEPEWAASDIFGLVKKTIETARLAL